MKPRMPMSITSVILLAALATPAGVAAQERSGDHANHHRYRLVDLGTFGGPESYINPAFALGSPNQINRRGAVVGAASTDFPANPTEPICGGLDGLVPFVFHAFLWQDGEKKDLGALPGIECSEAVSINDHGEVAGRSENGVVDPLNGRMEVHAVLWNDGEIRDLGTLGGNISFAISNNNRSQVAGFSVNTIPDPFSLFYFLFGGFTDGTQTRGFLWQKGQMRDLGTLGGPDTSALCLNDRGQVAGMSYVNSIPNPATGLPTAEPFLWSEDRGMIDLGSLGGVWGSACPLNNRGQVIGVSSLGADPGACFGTGNPANCHPFLWDDGKLIDLFTSTIGGNPITAEAINDAGEVVGNASFPNGAPGGEAYLWKDGVLTDLGTLPGDFLSVGLAINSRGQVVGQSFPHGAVLWEDGAIFDLNTLIPQNSDLLLDNAFAISDRGEIAGFGLPPGCNLDTACGHAFVLIPCDENHPGVEGCDYTLVDLATQRPDRPSLNAAFGHMPPPPALWRRNNRFYLPALGPRN